jgi:hypothetical protein
MSTITKEQEAKIREYLDSHELPAGLGTEESACSIAAINLSLTGVLTDKVPYCMSYVIGRWIIRVQDSMPSDIRNSVKWKYLLPLAAGTGRDADAEKRRMNIILGWMWDVVLPSIQPIADKCGYGDKWKAMTDGKTAKLAREAKAAAAIAADAYDAAYAATAAAADAAYAATYADAAYAAADAAYAATYADAAYAAYAAAADAADARKSAWEHFDPCSLLEKLIEA